MSFPTLDQSLPWSRCPEPRKRIELLKMSFPTLDQSLPWTKKTNRTLENELSNIRSVVALNQENESNSWKRAFQHSISRCPEPSKWIELLKMSFPTFDQSLPWTKKTNRTLENELSNARSVVALNQENESNSWKRAFQHSISRCPEPSKRIELLKTSFPTLDQSLPWTKKTNRTLEMSFPTLDQSLPWPSNVGKLIFKCSIRFLGSGQRLIERWKAHFQEFDSFSWFRARTDRALESSFSRVRFVFLVQGNDFKATSDRALKSSFSRVRFVFLVQGNDWSSVGKLIFKSSIRFLGWKQRLIECWKAHFQEFDSFSWFRATTDRMLESSFSRVRYVFLVQGNDWRKRIELLKMSFPTLDQSLLSTKKTNRTLENELSNARSVVALNQENVSNSWKRAFQHSISRCPEPSSVTTDQMLESSFSRVRFVFLVQGNDWSSVGKLVFKSSIRFLGSGQRLIECWKAHFQEFDSFSWFKATTDRMLESSFSRVRFVFLVQTRTDRMLESSFSRVRFVFLVQGNDWSNVGKLIFKSSIRLLGSGQRLIERWKAHFQEFDSFSWFRARTDRALESSFSRVRFVFLVQGNDFKATTDRALESSFSRVRFVFLVQATTDRALESSFSRVRFVFLVQGNDWSNVGKLIFKSSIRFLGSGQRLIECWKARFQEFDSFSWFRATTDRMLESSFSRVRFVFLVQGNDWSNVGKLIFKSSIRFLGSGQRLIECWKARFQEFDSFSWFRATTDRMLESSFSRVRFIYLVQGNDWSSVGKLIFKSSIRFLGSGQRLIECWKARFQEFDSFSWFKATTDRMLESSFSRVRFVFLVQGKDWSSVGKLIFKSSIRFLGSGQGLIERWKAHFQEFDSFSWFRATTDRMLESSFSRVWFVFLVQGNDWRKRIELLKMSFPTLDQSLPWTKKTNRTLENELSNARSVLALNQENESNSWKRAFQHSISRCLEPRKRIKLLKMSFPTFDQSLPWTKKTNRTLENELSNIRSVVALNQENESNSWKWAFQHSISRCPEPSKRIELLKMSFPTLDQSLPWTKKTNRTLENELSNIRSVVALNQENESNSWKWAFQRSISRCPEPRKRIELLKMSFPTLDQSLPWTKKTNRTLENELSNIRSVVALNQENESNSWKRAFQHSISRCPEPRKRIELLKTSFPTFDQSLLWTKKTNRTLENELSNIRSVVALNHRMLERSFSRVRFVFLVQGKDWSNVGKLIFKSSIRFLGSGQRLIECWKARFQEFDSFSWFRARTDRMLESSFSRVRFVFLVQGNDWSNVGKLIFKCSIRFLGSGQRLIERWKAHFQEFDSFSWFRARTDRALESSFSRVRFVFLVQGNDFKATSDRALKSSFSTRSVLALNQENESNSWKWAFQRSISRCPEPSSVGKLIFKSSIRFLGSKQRLIECWKAHFQEFDSFSWFRATTDRMLESSFSRVRFVFLVQGNDWSNVGKLVFKSSIRFLGSGQRLKKTNRTLENELSNTRLVVALNQENESNSWKWAFQRSISRCPEPSSVTTDQMLESSFSRVRFVFLVQGNDWSSVGKLVFKSSIRFLGSGQRLIECWKAHFQEFDSFSWLRATTDRMLESSFSRVRFVFLVQGNDWRKRIELLKTSFPTLDQSLPWTKKTNRTLENELSNIRSVVALNQENESNSWKWAFQHSISRCPEPSSVGKLIFKSSIRFLGSGQGLIERWKARFQEFDSFSWFRATTSRQRLIERWKAHFQEFDSFSWFRATTDRALESSFSRVRFVFLVQGNDWSNVGKLIFKSSIRFLGSGQRLKKTNRTLENELSNARSVVALNQENESNSWKWAFQHSISRCPEPRKRIELLKTSFPTFDQSLPWTKKTNRTLENELSNIRSVVALNQENESNSWKRAFQHSISRCPEPSKWIELLKMSFPTFDQSLSWTKKTNRTLENELSNIRSVVALNQENESNSWKWAFQRSISRCPEPK